MKTSIFHSLLSENERTSCPQAGMPVDLPLLQAWAGYSAHKCILVIDLDWVWLMGEYFRNAGNLTYTLKSTAHMYLHSAGRNIRYSKYCFIKLSHYSSNSSTASNHSAYLQDGGVSLKLLYAMHPKCLITKLIIFFSLETQRKRQAIWIALSISLLLFLYTYFNP